MDEPGWTSSRRTGEFYLAPITSVNQCHKDEIGNYLAQLNGIIANEKNDRLGDHLRITILHLNIGKNRINLYSRFLFLDALNH